MTFQLPELPNRPDAHVLGNIVDWEFVARNLDGEGTARADQPGC